MVEVTTPGSVPHVTKRSPLPSPSPRKPHLPLLTRVPLTLTGTIVGSVDSRGSTGLGPPLSQRQRLCLSTRNHSSLPFLFFSFQVLGTFDFSFRDFFPALTYLMCGEWPSALQPLGDLVLATYKRGACFKGWPLDLPCGSKSVSRASKLYLPLCFVASAG